MGVTRREKLSYEEQVVVVPEKEICWPPINIAEGKMR